MDKATLDRQISEATNAHASWREKLKVAASTGELPKPAAKIACDDDCPFGKWLHGLNEHSEIGSSAEYQDVVKKHASFHIYAGEVAAIVEKGDLGAAQKEINGPQLGARSFALTTAMKTWQDSQA